MSGKGRVLCVGVLVKKFQAKCASRHLLRTTSSSPLSKALYTPRPRATVHKPPQDLAPTLALCCSCPGAWDMLGGACFWGRDSGRPKCSCSASSESKHALNDHCIPLIYTYTHPHLAHRLRRGGEDSDGHYEALLPAFQVHLGALQEPKPKQEQRGRRQWQRERRERGQWATRYVVHKKKAGTFLCVEREGRRCVLLGCLRQRWCATREGDVVLPRSRGGVIKPSSVPLHDCKQHHPQARRFIVSPPR